MSVENENENANSPVGAKPTGNPVVVSVLRTLNPFGPSVFYRHFGPPDLSFPYTFINPAYT